MWTKIYALTRKSSEEKKDQLVPFVQIPRPVDIARKNNAAIKIKYKEYLIEQYEKERDVSVKLGRLYFALALDNYYYSEDCYRVIKKLANEDGYKVMTECFSIEFLVFCAPGEKYDRYSLCNKKNPEHFTHAVEVD
jgi:hypothetical protein